MSQGDLPPGISEAQAGSLPDLGGLGDQVKQNIEAQESREENPEPVPEAILVGIAQMLGQNVFRFPKPMLTEVMKMLEEGAFQFGICDVPALMSETGYPEWEISIGVNPEYRAKVQGEDIQNLNQDIREPDTLNVKGQATGVKREYSWAELADMSDQDLEKLGTSRAEVHEKMGSSG